MPNHGEWITVEPGVDMTDAIYTTGSGRLTKVWLRHYLRDNPLKDFRILSIGHGGSYLNANEVIADDLTLEVYWHNRFVAVVNFRMNGGNVEAVVR